LAFSDEVHLPQFPLSAGPNQEVKNHQRYYQEAMYSEVCSSILEQNPLRKNAKSEFSRRGSVPECREITFKGEGVMTNRHVFTVGIVLLAALVFFGAPLAALAAHPDVPLRQANGLAVSSTTPYSPKMTCGGCHFDCNTMAYSDVISTWCGTAGNGDQKDCSVPGNCPDYESMAVSTVNKVQGYITSAGTLSNMSYDVAVPLHGASTGKHSTEGRNEAVTVAQRTIWGAPANISSPGMWGRY
jgi:hypothetical protein